MPVTTDLTKFEAGLGRLLGAIEDGAKAGLREGAELLEEADRQTDAYIGMSGATRASTLAAVLDGDYPSKAASAYAVAASLLAGFTGHEGRPLSTDSGITLGPGELGIILTNFTDYAANLETEKGGQKAHLGPTMSLEAPNVTRLVAGFVKTELS